MKAKIGPCIVCGGRVLRNGKRKHDPEIHKRVQERRERAWYGSHRFPRLQVERVLDFWARQEGGARA